VGTPDQVVDKIGTMFDDLGGFGVLISLGTDYIDHADAWRESMGMLTREVMPKVRHLTPAAEAPALRRAAG